MNTLDRVMSAYSRTHKLSETQAKFVREELARFIDELVSGRVSPQSIKKGDVDPHCE